MFALDGKSFVIDLSQNNAAALRKVLAPYITAGRRVRSVRANGHKVSYGGGEVDPATVRAWANANGYSVSTRGRVSRELREAYLAAHS